MIKVDTPFGETKEEEVKEGMGQGGLDSAILSAASISNGVEDFFGRSEEEILYENLRIFPTSYQDDLMRMSLTVEEVRAGIARFEALAETKLLTFNPLKSTLVVVGPKKKRVEIEETLKKDPVMLNGVPMKVSNQERFLGEQITGENAESILATLKKRKGIVLMAISDIAAMMSDARARIVGGIEAGLHVWKLAVIPFLLNSADTWIGMSRGSEDILNDLYKMFLRRILQVPTSCPIFL